MSIKMSVEVKTYGSRHVPEDPIYLIGDTGNARNTVQIVTTEGTYSVNFDDFEHAFRVLVETMSS